VDRIFLLLPALRLKPDLAAETCTATLILQACIKTLSFVSVALFWPLAPPNPMDRLSPEHGADWEVDAESTSSGASQTAAAATCLLSVDEGGECNDFLCRQRDARASDGIYSLCWACILFVSCWWPAEYASRLTGCWR
jgi:hypothetical protein